MCSSTAPFANTHRLSFFLDQADAKPEIQEDLFVIGTNFAQFEQQKHLVSNVFSAATQFFFDQIIKIADL